MVKEHTEALANRASFRDPRTKARTDPIPDHRPCQVASNWMKRHIRGTVTAKKRASTLLATDGKSSTSWIFRGPGGFRWSGEACCRWSAHEQAWLAWLTWMARIEGEPDPGPPPPRNMYKEMTLDEFHATARSNAQAAARMVKCEPTHVYYNPAMELFFLEYKRGDGPWADFSLYVDNTGREPGD